MTRWIFACLTVFVLLGSGLPAQAALYRIDQRFGTVDFSVSTLGMFDVQGRFPRFAGELQLDAAHPDQTHIDVTIDANDVEMPLPDQVDLLRSPAYFDVAQHPKVSFISSAIQELSASHFVIHGSLRVRGVTQPQDLDAVLQSRGVDFADMVVTGQLKRSSFGMVADQTLLSDTVHLKIRIRLMIDLPTNAG